jgi:hypothetical protein
VQVSDAVAHRRCQVAPQVGLGREVGPLDHELGDEVADDVVGGLPEDLLQ